MSTLILLSSSVGEMVGEGSQVTIDDLERSELMTEIIETLTTGVQGVLTIAGEGFNFITANPLCMFMVSISFAGVALGLVKRAFRTARK